MKKVLMLAFGFGTITLISCSDRTTTTETTSSEMATTTATTTDMDATATTDYDYDMEYNDRADRISTQMATDLQLDPETQTRVRDVYYNRSRRLGEVEQEYYGAGRTTGTPARDTSGMYNQMRSINQETDAEFRGILSPQQYRSYEANRMNYDEFKYKSGDTKIKIDGDESKIKTNDMKIKTDGNESKIKTDDTKIKTDGKETKYKSGDTKIKTETK